MRKHTHTQGYYYIDSHFCYIPRAHNYLWSVTSYYVNTGHCGASRQAVCASVKSQQLPDVESLWYCIVGTNLECVAGSTDCHVSKILQPFLPHLICCSLVSSSALLLSPQPCTWQIDGINMKSGNVTFCMLYWFTVWMKVVIIQLYHWWSLLMPAQLIRSSALLSASSNVVRFSFIPQTILTSSISIWSLAAFNMKGEHLRDLVNMWWPTGGSAQL